MSIEYILQLKYRETDAFCVQYLPICCSTKLQSTYSINKKKKSILIQQTHAIFIMG